MNQRTTPEIDLGARARGELASLFERLVRNLDMAIPAGVARTEAMLSLENRCWAAADDIVDALLADDMHEEGKVSCMPWLGALTSGEPGADWRDTATGQLILGSK